MRILHVSSDPLPDGRVEKASYTAWKKGHELYFAGKSVKDFALKDIFFKDTFTLPWTPETKLHFPFHWRKLKTKFNKILRIVKPDIIHSHNIFSAKLSFENKLSMIYDDHEYWSKRIEAEIYIKDLKHWVTKNYLKSLCIKWEREIIPTIPTITASSTVADEHKLIGGKIVTVPNFLNNLELKAFHHKQKSPKKSCMVYIGKDFTTKTKIRNTTDFINVFLKSNIGSLTVIGDSELPTKPPIFSIGFLPHMSMLSELTNYCIGLIPWRPIQYHKYFDLNKAYQYAHAGLRILIPYTLESTIKNLGKSRCIIFKSFKELLKLFNEINEKKDDHHEIGIKIQRYAREHLLWENEENKIIEIYKKA